MEIRAAVIDDELMSRLTGFRLNLFWLLVIQNQTYDVTLIVIDILHYCVDQ